MNADFNADRRGKHVESAKISGQIRENQRTILISLEYAIALIPHRSKIIENGRYGFSRIKRFPIRVNPLQSA
jgi:hypothetical protein